MCEYEVKRRLQKKGVTTQRVYSKTTMSDDFELGGEDETHVKRELVNVIMWSHHKTGEHLCVYKAYTCIIFF